MHMIPKLINYISYETITSCVSKMIHLYFCLYFCKLHRRRKERLPVKSYYTRPNKIAEKMEEGGWCGGERGKVTEIKNLLARWQE